MAQNQAMYGRQNIPTGQYFGREGGPPGVQNYYSQMAMMNPNLQMQYQRSLLVRGCK